MSSVLQNILKNPEIHNVGSLNQWEKELLNQGAVVEVAAMDNYTIGELGFNAKGERTVKPLATQTKKGVLVASVEDFISEFETPAQFFNGIGDWARIVKQVDMHHFECSNFEKADASKEIKGGQVAHYDITKKKYIISNAGSNHTDYATAGNKYLVVAVPTHTYVGQDLVRFEIV